VDRIAETTHPGGSSGRAVAYARAGDTSRTSLSANHVRQIPHDRADHTLFTRAVSDDGARVAAAPPLADAAFVWAQRRRATSPRCKTPPDFGESPKPSRRARSSTTPRGDRHRTLLEGVHEGLREHQTQLVRLQTGGALTPSSPPERSAGRFGVACSSSQTSHRPSTPEERAAGAVHVARVPRTSQVQSTPDGFLLACQGSDSTGLLQRTKVKLEQAPKKWKAFNNPAVKDGISATAWRLRACSSAVVPSLRKITGQRLLESSPSRGPRASTRARSSSDGWTRRGSDARRRDAGYRSIRERAPRRVRGDRRRGCGNSRSTSAS